MARCVNQPATRLAMAVLVHAMLLAGIPGSFAADPVATAPAPSRPSPRTIIDLQPFRGEMRVPVQRADDVAGSATLTNLNPRVNAWFLLTLDWGAARPKEFHHLENARPARALRLQAAPRGFVQVDFGDQSPACTLPLGIAGKLPLPVIHVFPYWSLGALGARAQRYLPIEPDYLRYRWIADLQRMRNELGFVPGYTAEEALREYSGELRKRHYIETQDDLSYDTDRLRDTIERRRRARELSAGIPESQNPGQGK